MEIRESHFQFKNPMLDYLEFEINDSFVADEFDDFDLFEAKLDISRQEESAKVSLYIEIGDNDRNYPFQIRIVMSSEFRWLDSTVEQVDGYLNVNAPALLLSYMRPIVANITNSSKYEPLNLPFINFTETFEKRRKVDKDQPAE